jgi:hypothetical protein
MPIQLGMLPDTQFTGDPDQRIADRHVHPVIQLPEGLAFFQELFVEKSRAQAQEAYALDQDFLGNGYVSGTAEVIFQFLAAGIEESTFPRSTTIAAAVGQPAGVRTRDPVPSRASRKICLRISRRFVITSTSCESRSSSSEFDGVGYLGHARMLR